MTASQISVILSDNSPVPQDKLKNIPNLAAKLTEVSLGPLAKDEGIFIYPDYGTKLPKNFVLKSDNGKVWTTNVVGFLGLGDERLTIRSRFSSKDHDYFFLYLLEKVLGFRIVNFDYGSVDDELFSLFCFLFPVYLRRTLSKGMYKEYIWKKYSDSNLRGRLDIQRFIEKDNHPFMGTIPYLRREYSFDNRVTELVRCALEHIAGKSEYSFILKEAGEEAESIRKATPSYSPQNIEEVIAQNLLHPIDNDFYDYRPLQKLSLAILQDRKSSWGKGSNQVYGVLFDCAWLWEEYVNILIRDKFYHPSNVAKTGEQHLLYSDDGIDEIYPDFIGKGELHIIADAKYRPVKNIERNDRLRMIGYLWRFNSAPGYFIFPMGEDKEGKELREEKKWFRASGFNSNFKDSDIRAIESSKEYRGDLAMVAYGVPVPEAKTYEEFSRKMDNNGKNFANLFLKRITT